MICLNNDLKIGDLVFYNPTSNNFYADGTRQLGVIVDILKDRAPLFINFPDENFFQHEYKVIWIDSGYTSILLGFNLKKLEIVEEKT